MSLRSDPVDSTTPAGTHQALEVNTLLDGRYRLDQLIGRGSTAEVYRGTDELLGRPVAIKVFEARLTDLNTLVRQRSEMRALARVTHPNLIGVYDARIADPESESSSPVDRTYLVLELVPGQTLADLLTHGPIPADQVTRIGLALSAVLQVVHQQNLVHRDVKPANILLDDSGRIKLGDFGLARVLDARTTAGSMVMGTPAYFSPEQAAGGAVGPAADIYALGLVLLECLTGRKEFPGEPVAAAVARLLRDPVIPPTLPAPWPALLTAMTENTPQTRPTAQQVRAALAGNADEPEPDDLVLPLPTGPEYFHDAGAPTAEWSTAMSPFWSPPVARAGRSSQRQRWALAVLGAIGAVAAAVIWIFAQADADPPPAHPSSPAAGSMPLTGPAPRSRSASTTATVRAPAVVRSTTPPTSTRAKVTTTPDRSTQRPAAPPAATPHPTVRPVATARISTPRLAPVTTSAASATSTTRRAAVRAAPTRHPGKGHVTTKPPKKPKK